MTQALDKLSGLEAWRTSAEEATGRILTQFERLTVRLQRLETAPPHPPPPLPPMRPTTVPHLSSSRWTDPFDLNLAPPPATRPSTSNGERPSGHRDDHHHRDAGGGILGSHPPHPVTGMPPKPDPLHSESHGFASHSSRSPHLSKLSFPVFDGENPRLWRD